MIIVILCTGCREYMTSSKIDSDLNSCGSVDVAIKISKNPNVNVNETACKYVIMAIIFTLSSMIIIAYVNCKQNFKRTVHFWK